MKKRMKMMMMMMMKKTTDQGISFKVLKGEKTKWLIDKTAFSNAS
jgi:hypothetical protein